VSGAVETGGTRASSNREHDAPEHDAPEHHAPERHGPEHQASEHHLTMSAEGRAEGYDTVEAVVRHRLSSALGGVRGMVEGAVPTLGFTIAYLVIHQLKPALVIACGLAALLLVVRLVQRQTPQFVLNSAVGIAIAAVFALRSGRAEDVFLPGIIYSAVLVGVNLLSIVVRWPLVGLMIGAANPEDPFGWRRDPAVVKLCTRLTLILVVPSLAKVIVQTPLYLAGNVGWLGATKLALGWPLYLAAVAAALAVLARGHTPLSPPDAAERAEQRAEAAEAGVRTD
jgi:hypothetical protein